MIGDFDKLLGRNVVGLGITAERDQLCFFLDDSTSVVLDFQREVSQLVHIHNVFSLSNGQIVGLEGLVVDGTVCVNVEIRDQPIAIISFLPAGSPGPRQVQTSWPLTALKEDF